MKIEKDGIVKELTDQFMLADYINAGWRLIKDLPVEKKPVQKQKPVKRLNLKKEDK